MSVPYNECKDCVATPFCKIFSGEVQRQEYPKWCKAKFRLYKALELSEIPKEYLNANLYNYNLDENNKKVLDRIKPYIDNIIETVDLGKNMFFFSNYFGTGKTFHGAMFLNHYIYKTCLTDRMDFESPLSLFTVYADLINEFRVFNGDEEIQKKLDKVRNVPLLLLDDIGAGTMSDYAREQTYLILNYRFNNRLSTIVTSNLEPENLVKVLGERNVSRIMKNCDGAEIGGSDRRKRRRKKID